MYGQSEKLLNSNISFTCLHNMVNFSPLTAEIGWRVSGTSANFNGFRVLASLLLRRRSTEVNQTLHEVWLSPGLVRYVYMFGGEALAPNGILQGAKFTLRPSLAFSYIGSVSARHSNSGRQVNFAAWEKEGNYGTFAPRLRHLHSTGQPSHWASAHILVICYFSSFIFLNNKAQGIVKNNRSYIKAINYALNSCLKNSQDIISECSDMFNCLPNS